MPKIRKMYYADKKNTDEMISFLNKERGYHHGYIFNPFILLHHLIPLRYKFLPESFVLKDHDLWKGIITVSPSNNPMHQIEIQNLLFDENCYDAAAELVQYVVSRYKAMGTASILAKIDENFVDLINMFISKCGFSKISSEKLWKIDSKVLNKPVLNIFRKYLNSDSQMTTDLYNSELLSHIRPFLEKSTADFKEPLFKGLAYNNEFKFVAEDKNTKKIEAIVSIITTDNINYVLDYVHSPNFDIDICIIIEFAKYEISKRKKEFNLYVKTKMYTLSGENLEKELNLKGFKIFQSKYILTNSSAKIIKSENDTIKITILDQFYGGISVINKS